MTAGRGQRLWHNRITLHDTGRDQRVACSLTGCGNSGLVSGGGNSQPSRFYGD